MNRGIQGLFLIAQGLTENSSCWEGLLCACGRRGQGDGGTLMNPCMFVHKDLDADRPLEADRLLLHGDEYLYSFLFRDNPGDG